MREGRGGEGRESKSEQKRKGMNERSKQGQTNNKAKQHGTPKAVTFPKKNELPQVGLEHVHLMLFIYNLHIYMHVYLGSFIHPIPYWRQQLRKTNTH